MNAVKEAPNPKTVNGQGQTKEVAPQATTPQRTYATPFGFMRRFTEELDRMFEDFGLEAGWFMPRLLTRGGGLLGASRSSPRPSGRRGSRCSSAKGSSWSAPISLG